MVRPVFTSVNYCAYWWQFRCNNGQCINSHNYVCDGVYHCYDGSDENSCSSVRSVEIIQPSLAISTVQAVQSTAIRCSYGQFACANGYRCISDGWLCDGDNDCGDYSDEMSSNCFSSVETIKPSLAMVPFTSVNYCAYWWQFRCNNGQCIHSYYTCNGFHDCYDGSDEHSCSSASAVFTTIKPSRSKSAMVPFPSVNYCSWRQFRCNNGQCIPDYYVCDGGYPDCYDGSDEHSCPSASLVIATIKPSRSMSAGPFSTASYCDWWQFRCNNGQCIDRSYACDGRYHCYDGSDEHSCPSATVLPVIPSRANEGSQYGKHFVIGFTEQHPSYQTSGFLQISIVAIFDTTVTIRAATSNNVLLNSFVKAGQVIEYKPPVSLRMQGTNIERKGIEVNSTKDVAIFCLNHAPSTADAYIALPTDALGTVYIVASYKPTPRENSNIGIISGNDETKICIRLNSDGTVVYRGISYYRGSSLCVNLQKLETFHIKHPYDLSGTIIVSNKPISVISGDTCINVGVNGACDHVGVFLLPVRNWGKEFILASTGTMNRNTGDLFRIFAYENNTVVRSAYGKDVLSSGEFKEIDLRVDLASSVNCSKPCQVVQYTRAERINGESADPSIIVLPSVGQFLSYYHVVFPGGSAYADSITLFIKESYKNGLAMNGIQITNLPWQRINGTEYTWAVLNVSGYDIVNIYHSSREISFGLLVFGWKSYGSYGYPGGFALTDVHPAKTTKCQNKVDLGFILDSSGSVPRSDFQKMKTFVKDLTNFFTISPEESRVSVMSFSSQVNIHIRFSQRFLNKLNLDYAIDNIGYSGGGTATAMALTSAYSDMFTQRNGARGTEVKKVLIILTDGHSNTGMVSGPARQLKNSGVVIFSVGIGPHLSMPELYAMASEPTDRHVIRLGTFSQLVALAEQMSSQTCNASHFLVFCDNDFMTAVFDRADLPKHISIDRLYLRDRRCKAVYNSTHAIIKTPLAGCGTVYAEDDQTMFFTNTLSEDPFSGGGGVITRDYLFKANFTCSYGRKRTVGTFSFEPARQKLSVSIKGAGNLTFALDFYKSNSFIEPYTVNDYPVFKQLSDNIHIQYSVNTSNRDLVVHAESCRATPTNKPYDNPQYVFIADGCDNDSTIRHFGYGMSSVQRFSIQAFRFLTQHRFVYIHCDLVVCNRNYLNSTCARGNTCSRRYRRAVGGTSSSSDDGRDTYALSLGPLMYSNKPSVKTTGNSKAQSSMAMIGSVAGVGGVALVLAGALIYVLKRGRLRRVTPTPITHVIPMEQVDASA